MFNRSFRIVQFLHVEGEKGSNEKLKIGRDSIAPPSGCDVIVQVVKSKTSRGKGPAIDFVTPGKPLDVKVLLDKKQSASGMISRSGGSVSLTTAAGSKFTLEVPANAVAVDTAITMTAVKTLDGAPLDSNTPTAVQLSLPVCFSKKWRHSRSRRPGTFRSSNR